MKQGAPFCSGYLAVGTGIGVGGFVGVSNLALHINSPVIHLVAAVLSLVFRAFAALIGYLKDYVP